jgi:hypothetical protein
MQANHRAAAQQPLQGAQPVEAVIDKDKCTKPPEKTKVTQPDPTIHGFVYVYRHVLKIDGKVVRCKYICKDCDRLECPTWLTMDLHCCTVHGAIQLTHQAQARFMLGRTEYDSADERITEEAAQKPFQGPDGGPLLFTSKKSSEKLSTLEPFPTF